MGEAKKRGTYEQRKAEGEAKREERLRAIAAFRSHRGKSLASLMAATAMMLMAEAASKGEKP